MSTVNDAQELIGVELGVNGVFDHPSRTVVIDRRKIRNTENLTEVDITTHELLHIAERDTLRFEPRYHHLLFAALSDNERERLTKMMPFIQSSNIMQNFIRTEHAMTIPSDPQEQREEINLLESLLLRRIAELDSLLLDSDKKSVFQTVYSLVTLNLGTYKNYYFSSFLRGNPQSIFCL